jgi:hypothetical protein
MFAVDQPRGRCIRMLCTCGWVAAYIISRSAITTLMGAERERERELERKKKIELAADIFAKHSGLSTTRFLNANAPEHCASDKKVHLAPTKGSEL